MISPPPEELQTQELFAPEPGTILSEPVHVVPSPVTSQEMMEKLAQMESTLIDIFNLLDSRLP